MTETTTAPNVHNLGVHPVQSRQVPIPDQLMAIRQQIAALEAEADVLRKVLIHDPTARLGGDYVATIKQTVSYRVRSKDIEVSNPELFAQLAREVVSTQVYLTKRRQT